MIHIEQPLDAPRDPKMTTTGTRTIEDVIAVIGEDSDLPSRTKSDYKSALRTIAKAIGHLPCEVPANPPAITRRLRDFQPAELGLKSPSWANALFLARKAFQHSGCVVAPGAYHAPFTPEWDALADMIETLHLRYGLSRFMHVASESGWSPNEIGDAHFDRHRHALEHQLACKNVTREDKRVRLLWNKAVRTVPGWPQRLVHIAERASGYCYAWAEFPSTLKADVDAYRLLRSTADVFSEEAPCLLAPKTLKDHEFKIRQFASALVRSGVDIESLACVSDLLKPDRIQTAIRFFLARSDGQVTSQIFGIANVLAGLSRLGRGISSEDQAAALKTLNKVRKDETGRPRFRRTGLTEKNKRLLRQFDDAANLAKIVFAPDALCDGLPINGPLSVREAQAVRTAIMVELLLVFPIRETNLATLRLDKHFQWSRPGRQGIVSIYIQFEEVKNDVDLEVQLPERSALLLKYYLQHAKPVLGEAESPWLFPGKPKGHLNPQAMGEQFSRMIRASTGLRVNMHFMRHLCAKLFLDRNPGQYEVVRRALGHKSVETTLRFYAEFSSVAALKLVDENLLCLRRELTTQAPRTRRRPAQIGTLS